MPITNSNSTTDWTLTAEDMLLTFPVTLTSMDGSPAVEGDVMATNNIYFQNIKNLKGDLVNLYENMIKFDVIWTAQQQLGALREPLLWIVSRNNAKYAYKLPTIKQNVTTTLSVTVTEYNIVNDGGKKVTRGEFLLALTEVTAVLFPAVFFGLPHKTRYYSSLLPEVRQHNDLQILLHKTKI